MDNKYYFTYGLEGQPFVGGWTEVIAPNITIACRAFRAFHPDLVDGVLNCAGIYTEEQFFITKMARMGTNLGAACHETITLTQKQHI